MNLIKEVVKQHKYIAMLLAICLILSLLCMFKAGRMFFSIVGNGTKNYSTITETDMKEDLALEGYINTAYDDFAWVGKRGTGKFVEGYDVPQINFYAVEFGDNKVLFVKVPIESQINYSLESVVETTSLTMKKKNEDPAFDGTFQESVYLRGILTENDPEILHLYREWQTDNQIMYQTSWDIDISTLDPVSYTLDLTKDPQKIIMLFLLGVVLLLIVIVTVVIYFLRLYTRQFYDTFVPSSSPVPQSGSYSPMFNKDKPDSNIPIFNSKNRPVDDISTQTDSSAKRPAPKIKPTFTKYDPTTVFQSNASVSPNFASQKKSDSNNSTYGSGSFQRQNTYKPQSKVNLQKDIDPVTQQSDPSLTDSADE